MPARRVEYCVQGKFFRSETAVNPTYGAWWVTLDFLIETFGKEGREDLEDAIALFESEIIFDRKMMFDDCFPPATEEQRMQPPS